MTSVLCRRPSMTLLSLYDLHPIDQHKKMKLQVEKTQSKSVLEDLSNELLIEIFQFLSPYDLHRSVYNLNLRLNRICESEKLYLDLSCSKRIFDYYCSNQQPFPSQIYSLKLDDNCDRLTLFNQYISIHLFTNLRMLTIREPSSQNLDKILSKLHTLSHLLYLNIQSGLIQASDITVSIFKIRSLKRLILYSTDPILLHFDNNSIQPLTELEYLSMDDCSTKDFFQLLKYVGPNVKKMKIRLCYQRHEYLESIDPNIIDQLMLNHRIPVLLRRIEMKFNFLSLNHFHLILRLFPHLTHLTFSTLTNDENFISPSIWHQFICTSLLELKQLQFHIEIKGVVVQCPSTELIDRFYSMNRKWLIGPVVMDYNSLLIEPVLEYYTYPQSVCLGKYSLQFCGKKRYIASTGSDVGINIDKNVTDFRITLTDNQQIGTTIDQLLVDQKNDTYPKCVARCMPYQKTVFGM